tara:strand:- start:43068 stop:44084 length:1017 start_codon:yes stop_codon:yes gene_type:complete
MNYKIGVIGALGAVGQELIKLIEERNFPCETLLPLASARSAGTSVTFRGSQISTQEATEDTFKEIDLAFFCTSNAVARDLIPKAKNKDCIIIDNSAAFRQDPEVPLIIPEINASALDEAPQLIANPNCSTAIALMGLYPLHQQFGLTRFIASTYQAVSGNGVAGINELSTQINAWQKDEPAQPKIYPHPIAFNLIPQVDSFLESGYTKEEHKMLEESRKILELPELHVSTTCVRVPTMRAHAIAINAEFQKPINLSEAQAALKEFSGIDYYDTQATPPYPMPLNQTQNIHCGIGRLRKDTALDNGLAFWVVGDQLWKGAALNALQIAETLHSKQQILK